MLNPGAVARYRAELAKVAMLGQAPPDALEGRRAAVAGANGSLRADVCASLARYGAQVIEVAADGPAGHIGPLDMIVDLNLVGTTDIQPGAWASCLEQTYTLLGQVSSDWSLETRPGRHGYIAVTDLGGTLGANPEETLQPLSAIWSGLAKSLPREMPNCGARVVDIDSRDEPEIGALIAAELTFGNFCEVGWRGGERHVLVPRRQGLSSTPGTSCSGLARPVLSERSLVVFIGGARGIGYHCARRLRKQTGCRVVVSGRTDLSCVGPTLLEAGPEAFRDYCWQKLRQGKGGHLGQARAELAAVARAREVWANLATAREQGEGLAYEVCDARDSASVQRLLAEVCPDADLVVFDAGVDRPVRVGRKVMTDVRSVVSTKVDGLLNVLGALNTAALRPPANLCVMGSLTGRYGGTAGQSDYAGANEALARLCDWANSRNPFPVTCLSWPTWDSVGLITNPSAAVKEMGAIDVDAGSEAWLAEVLSPEKGEVLFMGPLGQLAPSQVTALPVPSDHEGTCSMMGRRALLGQVQHWQPGRLLVTRHRLSTRDVPALAGVTFGGAPAVPACLLLVLAEDASRWLGTLPNDAGSLEVRDLQLDFGRLTATSLEVDIVLERSAQVVRGDDDVDRALVSFCLAQEGHRPAATMLVGPGPAVVPAHRAQMPRSSPFCADLGPPSPAGIVSWTNRPGASWWAPCGDGTFVLAERVCGGDMFAGPWAPEVAIPVGGTEAVFRASFERAPQGAGHTKLVAEAMTLAVGGHSGSSFSFGHLSESGEAHVWDEGQTVAVMSGVRWLSLGGER